MLFFAKALRPFPIVSRTSTWNLNLLKGTVQQKDLAKIRLNRKAFIKDVSRKIRQFPSYESPLKLQRHLVLLLAIWKQIANSAHSSVSSLLFSTYSCWQRCYERFKPRMLLFVGNGAMNSSAILATAQWTLPWWRLYKENGVAALQREWGTSVQPLKKPTQVPPIPTARWISFPSWEFGSKLPTTIWGGAESLKGSHRMGEGRNFSKNLHTLF